MVDNYQFAPGMAIGIIPCDCCGDDIPIQLNKKLSAYANCKHQNFYTGEKCSRQHRWGKRASDELKMRYLDATRGYDNGSTKVQQEQPSGDLANGSESGKLSGKCFEDITGNDSATNSTKDDEHSGFSGSDSGADSVQQHNSFLGY